MSSMTEQQARRDQRVRELYKMNKRDLAVLVCENTGIVWSAHPLIKWSKDELVNEVLRAEFPAGVIHTTSSYSTPDDDFQAHAYCSCGWSSDRHYGKDEAVVIMLAEDAALSHVSQSCRLDQSGLYRAAS